MCISKKSAWEENFRFKTWDALQNNAPKESSLASSRRCGSALGSLNALEVINMGP